MAAKRPQKGARVRLSNTGRKPALAGSYRAANGPDVLADRVQRPQMPGVSLFDWRRCKKEFCPGILVITEPLYELEWLPTEVSR